MAVPRPPHGGPMAPCGAPAMAPLCCPQGLSVSDSCLHMRVEKHLKSSYMSIETLAGIQWKLSMCIIPQSRIPELLEELLCRTTLSKQCRLDTSCPTKVARHLILVCFRCDPLRQYVQAMSMPECVACTLTR